MAMAMGPQVADAVAHKAYAWLWQGVASAVPVIAVVVAIAVRQAERFTGIENDVANLRRAMNEKFNSVDPVLKDLGEWKSAEMLRRCEQAGREGRRKVDCDAGRTNRPEINCANLLASEELDALCPRGR